MTLPRAAYNVIIGGILLHLSLGTLYTWGCIQPYVTSYIRLYDASVTTQDTTIIYACGCLGHALAAPLVGLLQFRVGFRGAAMVGVALVSLSMLACSRAKTVAELAVLYSMFGVGIAIAYTCPLVCGYAWMPDRKGMVSGLIVAGFGAGAAVFDAVATAAVNPGDASPDPTTGYYGKEVAGRVPLMFIILGTCYLFLGMVGSSMISQPPLESLARGAVGVYSKLESGGGTDSGLGVDAAGGSASVFFEKGVHTDVTEDRTEPQEQRSTPRRHVLGADHAESVKVGAVEEEEHVGHNDLDARTAASLLPPPPPAPQMQGSGRRQEHADADMGSPHKSAIELGKGGIASSKGGVRVKGGGGGEANHQRQFKVLDLLRERNYYHLALSMMLTSVSGLYIAGGYKRIAQQIFTDADRFLSILGSVASLCNASGRILGGLSVDRFGCFPTLVIMSSSMTCALLSLGLVKAGRPFFFVTVCLVHILYGSNFAIYPTLTAEFFGVTSAGPNFGLVFMAFGVGAFASMLFLTKINHSSEVFLACAGVSFTGTSSVALLWSRQIRRGLIHHHR